MKRDKYLDKAFESLGYSVDANEDYITNVSDIDLRLKEQESSLASCETIIIECKENITKIKENIDFLTMLKHQVKVERYKELNPDREVF